MRGADEIVPADVRQGAITSHSLGLPELSRLIAAVPADASAEEYERAAIDQNVLGLATDSGRRKRLTTLRRLYELRPDSVLFRALRDLWSVDDDARPLLAALCALAHDSIFRASASVVLSTHPGDEVVVGDFLAAVESAFPGAYAASTLQKAADNAYASWQQSGAFADCLASPTPDSLVSERRSLARSLGVRATPSMILRGRLYTGLPEVRYVKRLLREQR